MRKNILLVGGSGFLGSNLATRFSEGGYEVGVLDRFAPPTGSSFSDAYVGDIRDPELCRRAFHSYRKLIYLAHETSTAPAADSSTAAFVGNIEIFTRLVELAAEKGIEECSLFSSGGAVYGHAERLPLSEKDPTNPVSLYGVAKLTMEKLLAVSATRYGFRHLIIRPSNPYGSGQNFRSAQGIVAVAMAKIARGEEITIFGDGSALKDYLYISDLACATFQLVDQVCLSGPFNVASGKGIPLMDVIAAIERTLGRQARVRFTISAPSDVQANVLDISKIGQATGWYPCVDLDEGLEKTWAWLRLQPSLQGI
jgi:UDP-glucose 4-epimerase